MTRLIIDGILLGLMVTFSFGPAFFAIIQNSISHGFRYGVFMALGIITSDAILISLSYLIGASIFDDPVNKVYAGIIGGIILIVFGSITWAKKPEILKKRHIKYKTPEIKGGSLLNQYIKGFFLNIANPFLFIFWFGALGIVSKSAETGKLLESSIIFFSTTLITVFLFDILKSYLGSKLNNLLKPRVEIYINKIIGILLVVFGMVLIFRTLNDFGFFDNLKGLL